MNTNSSARTSSSVRDSSSPPEPTDSSKPLELPDNGKSDSRVPSTCSRPEEPPVTRANTARVYDAWLGGSENLSVDRALAAEIAERAPWVPLGVKANRAFLERVVEFLARVGVDQFLDIGTGLPTARNVHQVAQDILPDVRVVYVDNDPEVVSQAQEILVGQEKVTAVLGDARDPRAVLERAAQEGGMDLSRPVALLFIAVLHFLSDDDDPSGILSSFRERLAHGSFLAVSHVTPVTGNNAPAMRQAVRMYQEKAVPFIPRNRKAVGRLFGDWELIPPGLVEIDQWRPVTKRRAEARVPALGAVARLVR
jgi:hypothetical protein